MDMSGLVELIEYIKRHKDSIIVLMLFYVFEIIIYGKHLFSIISALHFYYIEYWGLLLICVVEFAIWACWTHRWFFRDGWKVLAWLLGWVASACAFPLFVVPFLLLKCDLALPYVHLWGTVLWASVIFAIIFFCRNRCLNDGKLYVVFAVNVDGCQFYDVVGEAIRQTVSNIEYEFNNLHIVLPPLGFKRSGKKCSKYINSRYMQADALIFAKVTKGNQDGNLGYVFTGFESMVNTKRHKNFQNNVLNRILSLNVNCKSWHNYDLVARECESKIRVANNVQSLLLMYCSAFYILLKNFDNAIPVAQQMYSLEEQDRNSPVFELATRMLQDAYLFAVTNIEHNKHDYQASYDQLLSYSQSMPELQLSPAYDVTMARLMFLLGNNDESIKYTKTAYTKIDKDWGYYLNMGMYAMAESKVNEFVTHYRAMLKHPVQLSQITFAIEFIDDELLRRENNIKQLLKCAKLILQAYILPDNKWQRGKNAYVKSIEGNDELKKLVKLLNIVANRRKKIVSSMLLKS